MVYKFADDQGAYLAALITHYGFLSLFPLLLVLSTVLGFVLPDNLELQQQLIGSAVVQFPIIGDQLTSSAQPLRGSGAGLAIGIAVALYGGLGVAVAIQNALNQVWGVPVNKRPDPLRARARSLLLLILLGIGVLVTTVLSALGSGAADYGVQLGFGVRAIAVAVSVTVNAVLFVLAFRALTARSVSVRDVLPGALMAAVTWQILQWAGTWYISYELRGSTQVYGLFGIVLGLLAWIYLEALVVVMAAELNVVLAERLWPRALLTPFVEDVDLTSADRRSYRSYAKAQRYRESENITVEFEPASAVDPPPAGTVGQPTGEKDPGKADGRGGLGGRPGR
ncbi:YihY/virulence factor BrkB family protein [Pseudonocardia sp. TRM90224]|uniref:YihY/virulence factor BrkB family protein n=1 Tax=Pseudonocardia sp. TRM90224 TaxID=2812678 RepID=UPI001E3CC210|nr:YihY/virulence factor BrkB family protein [Pseudonocardia sp. TRM90224]